MQKQSMSVQHNQQAIKGNQKQSTDINKQPQRAQQAIEINQKQSKAVDNNQNTSNVSKCDQHQTTSNQKQSISNPSN